MCYQNYLPEFDNARGGFEGTLKGMKSPKVRNAKTLN